MSEITPASSLNRVADSTSPSRNTTATGVDLAPVVIRPSQILWRIEFIFYSALLCAASIALLPFFLTAFYWPIIWLGFCALVILVLRKAWRTKNSASVTLSIQKNIWRLSNSTDEFTVVLFDEILLWSWIIILPLRNPVDGKKYNVVALKDSMKEEDWRILRVWLRTGFKYL